MICYYGHLIPWLQVGIACLCMVITASVPIKVQLLKHRTVRRGRERGRGAGKGEVQTPPESEASGDLLVCHCSLLKGCLFTWRGCVRSWWSSPPCCGANFCYCCWIKVRCMFFIFHFLSTNNCRQCPFNGHCSFPHPSPNRSSLTPYSAHTPSSPLCADVVYHLDYSYIPSLSQILHKRSGT